MKMNPCKKCGSKNILCFTRTIKDIYEISCYRGHAMTVPMVPLGSPSQQVIDAWNAENPIIKPFITR